MRYRFSIFLPKRLEIGTCNFDERCVALITINLFEKKFHIWRDGVAVAKSPKGIILRQHLNASLGKILYVSDGDETSEEDGEG